MLLTNPTRVVFMGTPEFAVPSLRALAADSRFKLTGVVTQPDRPAGRGQSLRQSAVKQAALTLDLPIFQPQSLKKEAAMDELSQWQADIMVVAAYGQILKQRVLDMAPHGCVNVHASLLPKWRGAAPIQYAIRAGDEETGVTIMKIDIGLDSGPMLAKRAIPITRQDTASTMHDKLAELGADLLLDVLPDYLMGGITPKPQPEDGVTFAPTLRKTEGEIDWSQSAAEIDRLVRAFDPWPGTYTFYEGKRLNILSGSPLPNVSHKALHGTLIRHHDQYAVATGSGIYLLRNIKPAGKKAMTATAFAKGRPDALQSQLGTL